MPKRNITLKQLYRLADRDRRFFNAFLKNPRKALEEKGLLLSSGRLRKIERALNKKYIIKGKQLAKVLYSLTTRPPHPWPS